MASDLSRSSFQPAKHNSGVRMQQGRVQLDADWNEQIDIQAHLDRTLTRDVVGRAAAPMNNPGFSVNSLGNALMVGAGRIYVGGILCENEQGTPIASPAPASAQAPPQNYLVYLDVWEREITALEDPSIREIALGGPDTATRTRVTWQARLLPQKTQSAVVCPGDIESLLSASTGEMSARSQPSVSTNSPCSIAASSGYRSLENQLYRVEVHTPGSAGTATFKWSRDNATVTTAWLGGTATQLSVGSLGKDDVLGFAGGQWVELLDDSRELAGTPGTLVQLSNAQLLSQVPTLFLGNGASVDYSKFIGTPKVRRWDHTATAAVPLSNGAIPLVENAWLDLENGVQVSFLPNGHYNTGDYWLIPARTATSASQATLLWPTDNTNNPLPQACGGILHHYAPLAIATLYASQQWTVQCDCRSIFEPISTFATNVLSVNTLQNTTPVFSGILLAPDDLLSGLRLLCGQMLNSDAISLASLSLTIDLPVWNGESAPPALKKLIPAAYPVKVLSNYGVGSNGYSVSLVPLPSSRAYFLNELANFGIQTNGQGRALVRLTLNTDVVRQGSRLTAQPRLADGNPANVFTLSAWVSPYCDKTVFGSFVPMQSIVSVTGPDANGDYVVVGLMTIQNFNQYLQLPEPDVSSGRKLYCAPVTLAPGLTVVAYVPTDAERAGDFSTFGLPIVNTAAGGFYSSNHIYQPSILATNAAARTVFVGWRFRDYVNFTSPYYLAGHGAYVYLGSGIGAELI